MRALTDIGYSHGLRLLVAGIFAPTAAWFIAWSVGRMGHRASAATRHFVWLLSFVAMAGGVPFTIAHFVIGVPILPSKPVPQLASTALPVFSWPARPEPPPATFIPRYHIPPPPEPLPKLPSTGSGEPEAPASRTPLPEHRTWPWPTLLLASWVAGFLMLSLKSLVGVLRLRRVIRVSRVPEDDSLVALYSELCSSIGLRQPGRLSISAKVAIPLVTGLWRPQVILPESACNWPEPMLRAALVHELAHVRRNDLLSSAFARLIVSFYWFNPFAWCGLRALEAEAEMAADDWVVTLESQPVSYAESLVALVRHLRKSAVSPFPAIGMLRWAGIEARVERILDPACHRTTPRQRIRWVACCGAALLGAGFAVLRPVTAAPDRARPSVVAAASAESEPFAPEPFSMDLGYTDVVVINHRIQSVVYHLPAGKGPLFGQKVEPLLSASRTTPFALALERNYVTSVVYDYGYWARADVPFHGDNNWNVDSPGPGYREQRTVPNSKGFPVNGPGMNDIFN